MPYDPWQEALNSGGGIQGSLVKFVKGVWSVDDDAVETGDDGIRLNILMETAQHGSVLGATIGQLSIVGFSATPMPRRPARPSKRAGRLTRNSCAFAGQFGGASLIETGRESRARCAVGRREPEVRSAGGEVISACIWGGEGRARKDRVEGVQLLVAEQSQINLVFHVHRLERPSVATIEEGHRRGNASRRRGFWVLHYCGQRVDGVQCQFASGLPYAEDDPPRLDRLGPLWPAAGVARNAGLEARAPYSAARHRLSPPVRLPVFGGSIVGFERGKS
jgi:hypothetical protein